MTIAHTLRMDYDLKMYPEDTKDGNVLRMISAQRARYKAYYDPIDEDLESRNLNGTALTEWKYQRYMRDYLGTAGSLDRNTGRVLDFLEEHGLAETTLVIYLTAQCIYMGQHGWLTTSVT